MLTGIAGATLAFAAAPAVAADHPDAELLVACAHYKALEAAFRATAGNPERGMEFPAGYDEAVSAVIDLPATTREGAQAKALAAITYHEPDFCAGDALMWAAIHAAAEEYAA